MTGPGAAEPGQGAAAPGEKTAHETDSHSEVLLRLLKGEPSAEELAALVAVVAAGRTSPASRPPVVQRSEWGAHARKLRGVHRHSPGAWRASAWPG